MGISRKILVVEDEEDLNRYLCAILKEEGFSARGCLKGEEALALLKKDPPDLLILDILLPDLTGIHLLKTIREEWKNPVPVLVITVDYEIQWVQEAFTHGANGYIAKPFDRDELLRQIREILG
jgi:DNA-binding response OmpR family regulator